MIVLIRHAMPVVEPGVPSGRWRLGEEGRAAARALGADPAAVPRPSYFVASDEPKAAETIEEMTDQLVGRDSGFAEVRRPDRWSDDYRAQARAYVEGGALDGWEPHDVAARRFDEAVVRHLIEAVGKTLVIGTHGLAPTVWLAARGLVTDPGAFWADLRFPDAIHVDLGAGTVAARQFGRDEIVASPPGAGNAPRTADDPRRGDLPP